MKVQFDHVKDLDPTYYTGAEAIGRFRDGAILEGYFNGLGGYQFKCYCVIAKHERRYILNLNTCGPVLNSEYYFKPASKGVVLTIEQE